MAPDFNPDDLPTLDPPGTIVVIGTTPVGIEAALYGRYLGYNVTLIAGVDAWMPKPSGVDTARPRMGPTFINDWFARHWLGNQSIQSRVDDAVPMLPDQSLSPLAIEAITAQREGAAFVLPITMRQWIDDGLHTVLETDLLRGRWFANTFVESIELADVIDEDDVEGGEVPQNDDGEIPPDFLLTLRGDPIGENDSAQMRFECIIVADLPIESIRLDFKLPVDYFYRIASADLPKAADELRAGWRRIADIYAGLAGRSELNLYRPRRL